MADDFTILDALHALAEDLDLVQEDDRVTFRSRFEQQFAKCTVRGLRKYAREVGAPRVGQSRADAMRHITSTYIINSQLGRYDTDTVTVTLTRAEAQALHNRVEGPWLVSAQTKLEAAMGVTA